MVLPGDESVPGSRPIRAEWTREVREQCLRFKRDVLFKQWRRYSAEVVSTRTRRRRVVSIRMRDPRENALPRFGEHPPDGYAGRVRKVTRLKMLGRYRGTKSQRESIYGLQAPCHHSRSNRKAPATDKEPKRCQSRSADREAGGFASQTDNKDPKHCWHANGYQ